MSRYLVDGLMSLFFPADCLLCGKNLEPLNRSFICLDCWKKVKWLPSVCCVRCGRPLSFVSDKNLNYPSVCLDCRENPPHFKRLFSPTVYQGVIAEAIKLFKYNGKRGIIRGFIQIIDASIHRFNLTSLGLEAIVPVPLHSTKLRERGFNQAKELAKVISRYLNVPVWSDYLIRVRYTRPQTKLRRKDREENMKRAFSIRKGAKNRGKGKRILLVDDVYTTGVTLNEASYEMKKDGAEVFSFTLARALEPQ